MYLWKQQDWTHSKRPFLGSSPSGPSLQFSCEEPFLLSPRSEARRESVRERESKERSPSSPLVAVERVKSDHKGQQTDVGKA